MGLYGWQYIHSSPTFQELYAVPPEPYFNVSRVLWSLVVVDFVRRLPHDRRCSSALLALYVLSNTIINKIHFAKKSELAGEVGTSFPKNTYREYFHSYTRGN